MHFSSCSLSLFFALEALRYYLYLFLIIYQLLLPDLYISSIPAQPNSFSYLSLLEV